MMARTLLVLGLIVILGGCGFSRYLISDPDEDQIIRVEAGDRYYFKLDEDALNGYEWVGKCNDDDVELIIDHERPTREDGQLHGKACVRVRIHRGYDGPSELTFTYRRKRSHEEVRSFTLTLYRHTGDAAFWTL